jgi:hypothetical protein
MKAALIGFGIALFCACAPVTASGSSKKPCEPTLDACPERGCAKPDTPSALSNILKHNLEPTGDAIALTFPDFARLQAKAEAKLEGHYSTLGAVDIAKLHSLKLHGKSVGERHLVEIVGYIAVLPGNSKPHANTGESVNCRLHGSKNNDFHISLTPEPGGSEYKGIVVEMIPQQRNKKWTTRRLRAIQKAGLMVRVSGQLFFDNHHRVNSDPDHNIGNQPKRMSLWEVHPITAFDVCTKSKCAIDGSGWQPLAKWKESK